MRSASPSPITTSPVLMPTRSAIASPWRRSTSAANSSNRCCSAAPAATARRASSSATSGMPKVAIIPSPMNLATVPACASIVSWSSAW